MSNPFSSRFFMDELRDLSNDAKEPMSVEKAAGELIVERGKKGRFMFVIDAGTVKILFKDRVLERASKGDIVGEMALIDDVPRSASIIAETDCRLIPISKWRFLHLVRKDPKFSLHVMKVMNRRLRRMNERMAVDA